ncbi:hypothetical protein [Azotobacter beijerinckii]|uniref:Uncharacterized protein n=1 Tax=Azotobacter beijerinckii TaxID=170623 RepID=A0A1I4C912_9GAMM|nr:hypothetical protein [Azotobacter beijerinckii]SFB17761.1 hypothetical protein SAMN04244571_01683 [Azotobacter beijerinckii]SFK77664.1 hypothetical protein SAMN04244574_01830 [Azotobacter beijerinckii]
MARKWQQTGLPFRFKPANRIVDTPPAPANDGAHRETATLAKLCGLVVDLIRGKRVWMNAEEREALLPMIDLGYLQCDGGAQDASSYLCHCSHPALFEFYFFYRWLPEHGQRFRPRRELPGTGR